MLYLFYLIKYFNWHGIKKVDEIGKLRKYVRERMVLLSLLVLLWSTVPVRSSSVVSHCYSWGGCGKFSLTFCKLSFTFGLSGGKSLVFLTWLIFIWTTLFSFLSFSGLLAWGKIVRKLSYSLDKLEIPTYFSLKNHPKGETNFNTWLAKQSEEEI